MFRLPDIIRRDRTEPLVAEICAVLRKWNIEPIPFRSQVDIQHEGDRPRSMYLIRSGWIYSYAVLADGQRQILFLHQPGDIAGLADFGAERVSCSMRSLGECVVLPIPFTAIATFSSTAPDIITYLLQKSAQMQSILMRTLTAVGRMEARHRVIWLILMLHERISGSVTTASAVIEIPFNQSEIGDLIGLTNVSVSKMLCQLSDEGFIERKGSKVLLRRVADMQAMINYEPMGFSEGSYLNLKEDYRERDAVKRI
ncbi:hypothetical protein DC366_18965 [Pelagivirga sediminicola]|uniref:HTH crp-type domain-containing protein n=1 Tax=Pelagivirga sediminicola TaxID=2170575 RepID=A0A2T7G253_9RHOB|nr:Crp/Fnr family transcriptional regulator [Pelagivirga sediminicola]PVA08486.1 hypothetical protein DC366_18965 [Pelagivirga sediminicola]